MNGNLKRSVCDCGNVAVIVSHSEKICRRCHDCQQRGCIGGPTDRTLITKTKPRKNNFMKKIIATVSLGTLALAALAFGPTIKVVPAFPPSITVSATSTETNATHMNFYASTATAQSNTLLGTVPLNFTNGVATASLPVQPAWAMQYQFLGEHTNTFTGAASANTPATLYVTPNGPLAISLAPPAGVVLK